MDKKISIKNLRELLIINPDISAEGLVDLAYYYVDVMEKVAENETKIIGDKVRIQRVSDIVVKEYKSANEQALEEYKQKFLADIEKLKAEKEKKYNNNEVK